MADDSDTEILRKVRTDPAKYLQFIDENVWFAGYRGTFGWTAYRSDGAVRGHPDESDVKDSVDVCDSVRVVDIGDVDV